MGVSRIAAPPAAGGTARSSRSSSIARHHAARGLPMSRQTSAPPQALRASASLQSALQFASVIVGRAVSSAAQLSLGGVGALFPVTVIRARTRSAGYLLDDSVAGQGANDRSAFLRRNRLPHRRGCLLGLLRSARRGPHLWLPGLARLPAARLSSSDLPACCPAAPARWLSADAEPARRGPAAVHPDQRLGVPRARSGTRQGDAI